MTAAALPVQRNPPVALAALYPQPAGPDRLHRHPDPVRDRGLLFLAALSPQLAGAEGLHLVQQLHFVSQRSGILEHGARFAALYRPDRGRRSAVRLGDRAAAAKADGLQQHRLGRAAAAADDRAGARGADVEADDEPEFRRAVLSRPVDGSQQFQMGVVAEHRAVHGRSRRRLGLHPLHHDPVAGGPALAAARSPSRRPRSTAFPGASSSSASRCRCCCPIC